MPTTVPKEPSSSDDATSLGHPPPRTDGWTQDMNYDAKVSESKAEPRQLSKRPPNAQLTAYRRRQVAALRLRGMTLDEIVKTLATLGVVNPETQQPFGRVTVHNDLRHLETQWRDKAAELHHLHKAKILAELRETRRAAWQDKKYSIVLRGLQLEADLFGLFAPIQVAKPPARAGNVIDAETWTRIANDMTIDQLEAALVLRDLIAKHTSDESVAAGSDGTEIGHPLKQTA